MFLSSCSAFAVLNVHVNLVRACMTSGVTAALWVIVGKRKGVKLMGEDFQN